MTTIVELPDLVRGDDVTYMVAITDESDAPINVVGDLVTMTVKKNTADPDIVAVMQNKVRVADATDGQGGIVYIPFTNAQTDVLNDIYNYDVQWVRDVSGTGTGEVVTVIMGTLKILKQVTQDRT